MLGRDIAVSVFGHEREKGSLVDRLHVALAGVAPDRNGHLVLAVECDLLERAVQLPSATSALCEDAVLPNGRFPHVSLLVVFGLLHAVEDVDDFTERPVSE